VLKVKRIEEIKTAKIIRIVAYVKDTVPPKPPRLVNLKIKAYAYH